MILENRLFDALKLGDTATATRLCTADDLYIFAAATGNHNPLHLPGLDGDGDGQADLRETWYKGFAEENSQLRANHPRFGLDNHIYISNGLRGGTVVDARKADSKPVDLNGKDFRFDPTSFEFEALKFKLRTSVLFKVPES